MNNRYKLTGRAAAAALIAMLVAACSGGSGGGGSEREIDVSAPPGSSDFVYSGPAPGSDEIQSFKREFYDPLAGNDRCGQCHTPGGSGTTYFVNQDNVNEAWQQAQRVVNLSDPAASAVVRRVAEGHNCWLAANQAATCATTITGYIERWAADVVQSAATVQLAPRRPYSPQGTKILPGSAAEVVDLGLNITAEGELLGLLRQYCAGCHADTAPVPQVPYFASGDDTIAFEALRGRINLVEPATSRIVVRLFPEAHNCWSDCASNADTLHTAVQRLAAQVPAGEVDPRLRISTAQVLEADGIAANTGGRFEADIIAKWEFREGTGTTTADTSGVQPEIPLSLSGQYSWMGSWGIRLVNGKAQGGVAASSKLFERITATGEYTVEAWVAPDNVAQEMAWIVGYAGGPDSRNLLLQQSLYNYEAFNRSSVTEQGSGGEPALVTDDDAEFAQATLQHVVLTYDPVAGRRLYVNGVYTGDEDSAGGGLLNNWSEAFAVVLGNDTAGSNPWAGALRMVAVHNRALNTQQIAQNFEVGVGQKYFLLFSVAETIDREGVCHAVENGERTNYCYVVFEVSQFDDSAYLFNEPFFVNINPAGGAVDFSLAGIRLGVNGKLAEVGQAFVNVAAQVNASQQALAAIGTVIPLENGADQDVFFLAFDELAGASSNADDGAQGAFAQALVGTPASDVGLRTFDEINASFAALTGIGVAHSSVSAVTGKTVAETYRAVRRALPGVADFNAFMSSHQMAATQLAAAYCDAMVQDSAARQALFPAFDFGRPVGDSGIDWRGTVVTPLVDRASNEQLLPATLRNQVLDEVTLLITDSRDLKPYVLLNGQWVSDPNPAAHNKRDGLIYCANDAPCPASRTQDVVKAACTAVLGSALVLVQ